MSDVEYKLTYFPIMALAEPIRLLLSYNGNKFDDIRIPKEDWDDVKQSTPFGQVPTLEVNGKLAHQSVAIARYIAKQTDLMGCDDWENLEIDAMVDTITDLRSKVSQYNIEKDKERKAEILKNLDDMILPYFLSRLDDCARSHNGYLAIGRMTWADIYFVGLLDYCNGVLSKDIIKDFANLCNVRENVLNVPSIKQWIDNRPDSEY